MPVITRGRNELGADRALFARWFLGIFLILSLWFAGSPRIEAAGPVGDALELYKARLVQTGARLRSYPEEALAQKLTGTAVVTVSIDSGGRLARNVLAKSSGHRILDEYALAMMEKAVPATEIPFSLRNTAFTIEVTVVFAVPEIGSNLGFLNQ